MMGRNRKIRVAIADRHDNFREACKRILSLEADIELVSESGTGFGLAPLIDLLRAEILLFDEKIGEAEGTEVFWQIRQRFPDLKILYMVSSIDQKSSLEAVHLGANGVIEKGRNTSHLPTAIRKIIDGQTWISRRLTSALVGDVIRSGPETMLV
ncbi:MAG: response regulator [Pyrinomonadaceae bacterium]